jgi:hypothetical protein
MDGTRLKIFLQGQEVFTKHYGCPESPDYLYYMGEDTNG